jgi:O-antigen/teichoic acid export membrane protein
VVSAFLIRVCGKWRPDKKNISFEAFKRLFKFSSKLLITGTLSTLLTNINSILIGRIYQQQELGYYTRARQFGELTSGIIASVLQTSTFPLLSSLQDNKSELVAVYRRLLKITTLFVFPAMTGLALLSKQIIMVLLTEKWLPCADLLFWTAFTFIFTPLSMLNLNILNAIGRSDLFLKVDLTKIPLIVLTIIITFPISIKAVVIGNFLVSFIAFFINAYLPGRLFGYGPFKQIKDAGKIIISTCVMAAFLIFIQCLKTDIVILVIGIFCGILVYFITLLLLKEEEIFSLLSVIRFHK